MTSVKAGPTIEGTPSRPQHDCITVLDVQYWDRRMETHDRLDGVEMLRCKLCGSQVDELFQPVELDLLLMEMAPLEQEHLRTVIMDSKNHVLKIHTAYIGSLNTAVVRVGELFREAIRLNAVALIVAHNHPSGDPTPSPVMWTINLCRVDPKRATGAANSTNRVTLDTTLGAFGGALGAPNRNNHPSALTKNARSSSEFR